MVLNRIGSVLIATLDRETDASSLRESGQAIGRDVHRHHDRSVVLDFGAVEILDSADAAELVRVDRTLRLIGARVVIAGLRPEVVAALTIAGTELGGLDCVLDVGQAMQR